MLRRLVASGRPVRGLARDDAEAAALDAAGATPCLARFEEPDGLRRALGGVGAAFLSLPLGLPTATVRDWGRRAVAAARDAGVGVVVFNTGTRIPAEPTDVDAFEE